MFKISFNFDEINKKISNIEITNVTEQTLTDIEPQIQVLDNKLKLTSKAIELIGAVPGERITVNYWTENNHSTFPLIGKSEYFTDKEGGTKLTKSNTLSFRGNQHTVLEMYGKLFKLEPFKDGVFKLVVINSDNTENVTSEQTDLNNLESSEIDEEINNILTKEEDDDLPF